MLPFKNRLTKRKDIERVLKYGRFCSNGNIVLKFQANNLKETRIGFIVGLKYSKKAVERNHCKRLLREKAKEKLKNISAGWDIIIMARKQNEERISPNKLNKDITRALEETNIIKE